MPNSSPTRRMVSYWSLRQNRHGRRSSCGRGSGSSRAGGKLIGAVLNQRQNYIPDFLYRVALSRSSGGSIAVRHGTLAARLGPFLDRFRSAIVTGDQMAVSLFNFASNLALIRILTPAEMGEFSLWSAVALLAVGVQNAAVGMPLNVYVPAKRGSAEGERLERSVSAVNWLLSVAIILLIVGVNVSVEAEWVPHGLALSVAVPVFIAVNLAREYYRSIAFGRGDMLLLLLADGPFLVLTALCVLALLAGALPGQRLFGAFAAIGVGWAGSQLLLSFQRPRRRELFGAGWITPYRTIGKEIGWSLAGVFATNAVTRSYVYLATALAGFSALAAINAMGVLFRPVGVLMTAWGRLALPRMSVALAQGRASEFGRSLAIALAVAAAGSLVWTLVLWSGWSLIARYLLAGKYPDARAMLVPWAATSIVTVLEYIVGVALNAAREFRFLAWIQVYGGVVTIATTAALILSQGYLYTMYGTAIGGLVCLVAGLIRLRAVYRRLSANEVDGAVPARVDGRA